MKLNELKAGQPVNVQLIWGNVSQEVATRVLASDESSLTVGSFNYKGKNIDLSSGSSPDMTFNVYGVDPATSTRKVWTDMNLESAEFEGKACYRLTLGAGSDTAVDSERRKEIRMVLDIPGAISKGKDKEPVPITIHDISSIGISLLVPSDEPVPSAPVDIMFSDIVNTEAFMVPVKCRPIRSVVQPRDILGMGRGTTLWGCSIEAGNESLVTYILVKRTSEKK